MDKDLPAWAAHALDAAARSRAVFPVLTKHVIPVKWGREATSDPAKIRRWAREFPDAMGYGIALRQDEYVFDADSNEAVAWCEANMPPTYCVRTGRKSGGVHFYYWVQGGRRLRMLNTRLGELFGVSGLDGKTRGGYVVGPGSLHESGARYTDEGSPGHVATLPAAVADRIGDRPLTADTDASGGLTPAEQQEFATNSTWGRSLRAEAIEDAYVIRTNLVRYLRATDERWSDAFLEASIKLGTHVPSGAITAAEAVAFMTKVFEDEDTWGTEGNVVRSIRRGIAHGARSERASWL